MNPVMLITLINTVLRYRLIVILLLLSAALYSLHILRSAPLDALPDIADPQIVIQAQWARSPEVIDQTITAPLVRSLLGLSGVQAVRATSHLGYSFIYVILTETDQRQAVRLQVQSTINTLQALLPTDARLELGPDAGSMGWIYQYALVDHSGTRDLRQLRLLNERQLKPALEQVSGIAEVATVGGLEKQVELKIFPPLLAQTGITLSQLIHTLQQSFSQVGGRTLELTNRDYQLRATLNHSDLNQLELLVLGHWPDGRVIVLKDIGYLQIDYDLRRGIADLDGKGEVVGAIVIMEQDRNVLAVTSALHEQLDVLRARLPDGVEMVTTYDRSGLIWKILENFTIALAWELAVVILVLVLVLRNRRAAMAPVVVIFLSLLYALSGLAILGETINLLSLAGLAIAIGVMADATIVIIENCSAVLAQQAHIDEIKRRQVVIGAMVRMLRPLLFSLLIILVSFLPVFFLGEREGRLFDPLAFSKTFAMGATMLLTLCLLPILVIWAFKSKAISNSFHHGAWVRCYRRLLILTLNYRYGFVALSLLMIGLAVLLMSRFDTAYMPELEEGAILYMPTTLPGLPMREAGWVLQAMDRKLKSFPEVERVFGKLGRADSATDPAPVTMIETTILLKPQQQWRQGMTREKLVSEMDVQMKIIGYVNSWTQPIAGRVLMQGTGIQSPVGLKIKGHDLELIETLTKKAENLLSTLPGMATVLAERIVGGDYVDVQLDLTRLAEHGIQVDEAMLTVRHAVGGEHILDLQQSDGGVVPLSLRYSPEYIDTLEKVANTAIISAAGRVVTLESVADVSVRQSADMIRNDNGERAGYLYINLEGVTASDYVSQAKTHLARHLDLPPGYTLEWTGTHRYAEQAQAQLLWVIPVTLLLMFILLMMAFRSVAQSMVILLAAPFALVGGVLLQWSLGYAMTTAVIIGYLAVLAIAIQTGILMVLFIREALARNEWRRCSTETAYLQAVIEGSVARLRPKLITVSTTVLALLPIVFARGSGMEITQPIAAPIVGGMLSSTLYVLFIIPCLFMIGRDLKAD